MRIAKKFLFREECRGKIFNGMQTMYDAVSATLGPHGRTVLLRKGMGMMEPSKDGVTVADEVYPADEWEAMGAQLIREAAQKANTEAGDSTTTAIVLAYNIAKEGLQEVNERGNVYQISKGIKIATDAAVKKLEEMAIKIDTEEEFAKVATISTQDEDIGKIIAKTFFEAGTYGSIDIERSDVPGIIAEKTEGISFDKGWQSKGLFHKYLTDIRQMKCIQTDVPVLVVEDKIENESQLFPMLEMLAISEQQAAKVGHKIEDRYGIPFETRKLIVISDDFSSTGLGLIMNNDYYRASKGMQGFHLIFIQAPSFGRHKVEVLQDIAAVTSATFISRENGTKRIEHATLADLGRASKIVVEDKRTIIVSDMKKGDWGSGVKQRIADRVERLKAEITEMPSDHIDKKELEKRLATLTDGVSVLKVGSDSEVERNELRRRVEDGVRSVRSAREEGVTPGCGVALLQCIKTVDTLIVTDAKNNDQKRGMMILRNALRSVAFRLLEVAYIDDFKGETSHKTSDEFNAKITADAYRSQLVDRMTETGMGYDFNNDCLADMLKLGVYDAKKAVRVALQSAVSCAITFLKIDCAITHIDEDTDLLEKLRCRLINQS